MNIYETVDKLKKKQKTINKKVTNKIKLIKIINLHNSTGIKDNSQIKFMIKQINSGKDILSPKGLPNIKLVKQKKKEWILFDGHHSLLAYMVAGRKYLNEVPHIIVENKDRYVTDKEIIVFFGKHQKKLKNSNWRKYVINWQASEEKQLCKRIQKNMGELLKSIMAYL